MSEWDKKWNQYLMMLESFPRDQITRNALRLANLYRSRREVIDIRDGEFYFCDSNSWKIGNKKAVSNSHSFRATGKTAEWKGLTIRRENCCRGKRGQRNCGCTNERCFSVVVSHLKAQNPPVYLLHFRRSAIIVSKDRFNKDPSKFIETESLEGKQIMACQQLGVEVQLMERFNHILQGKHWSTCAAKELLKPPASDYLDYLKSLNFPIEPHLNVGFTIAQHLPMVQLQNMLNTISFCNPSNQISQTANFATTTPVLLQNCNNDQFFLKESNCLTQTPVFQPIRQDFADDSSIGYDTSCPSVSPVSPVRSEESDDELRAEFGDVSILFSHSPSINAKSAQGKISPDKLLYVLSFLHHQSMSNIFHSWKTRNNSCLHTTKTSVLTSYSDTPAPLLNRSQTLGFKNLEVKKCIGTTSHLPLQLKSDTKKPSFLEKLFRG